MSNLTTAFLIFVVLVFGVSSYSVLQLTGLTPSINILIAACCRTLSLLIYRYYSLDIQEIPAWIVFQWLIPLVVMGELIIAACIVASGLGKVGEVICWSETTNSPILFICFDIITFIYLTTLLNHPSSLGPFGAMHLAILQAIRSAFGTATAAVSVAIRTALEIQSIFEALVAALQPVLLLFAPSDGEPPSGESRPPTSRWSHFWTGSNANPVPDPEMGLNVSPPPYTSKPYASVLIFSSKS